MCTCIPSHLPERWPGLSALTGEEAVGWREVGGGGTLGEPRASISEK